MAKKNSTDIKTDLNKLLDVYHELGIQYHRVISKSGYTYIQKKGPHDKDGHIHVFGHGLVVLKQPEQLTNFIEFDKKGKIASW
jgi:hypothetical protein